MEVTKIRAGLLLNLSRPPPGVNRWYLRSLLKDKNRFFRTLFSVLRLGCIGRPMRPFRA